MRSCVLAKPALSGVGSKQASGILIILHSDHSYGIYRPMKHRRQLEAAHTAMDSKDLLCSKWSMYIARSCQKPYGSLAFTIQRNAPDLALKWHEKPDLTAMVKRKSTAGAEELGGFCSCLWSRGGMPVPLTGEARADWNLTRTYYFRNFFSGIWFQPPNSLCTVMDVFLLDIFWSMTRCIVCELHIEMGVGESTEQSENREREWNK